MSKVKQTCPTCQGTGVLQPLGFSGLAEDSPDLLDVKRGFPRPCDACSCSGKIDVDLKQASG